MPYSQTHLAAACKTLAQPSIRTGFPWLQQPRARAAFFLGAIGPDARVVSGVPREATHFYDIPRVEKRPIMEVLLDACPELQHPQTRQQAAFGAGYIIHLVMDVLWLEHIVMPVLFIEGEAWGPGHPNWVRYNLLMAHLEVRGSETLCDEAVTLLPQAQPEAWIGCLSGETLAEWARHIARVIRESGPAHVITLLARSSEMTLGEFSRTVRSHKALIAAVGPTIDGRLLAFFQREVAQRSEAAVLAYLTTLEEAA